MPGTMGHASIDFLGAISQVKKMITRRTFRNPILTNLSPFRNGLLLYLRHSVRWFTQSRL